MWVLKFKLNYLNPEERSAKKLMLIKVVKIVVTSEGRDNADSTVADSAN